MLYSAMLARKALNISPSSSSKPLRIRTYKTPLQQLVYNQQLQRPKKSVHSKRLTTPLESALTQFVPPNPFILRTYKKHRGGGGSHFTGLPCLCKGTIHRALLCLCRAEFISSGVAAKEENPQPALRSPTHSDSRSGLPSTSHESPVTSLVPPIAGALIFVSQYRNQILDADKQLVFEEVAPS
jgi:hypothetical protein